MKKFVAWVSMLSLSAGYAAAAVVSYVGVHETVEDHANDPGYGWRSPGGPPKPLDIDGDGVYGTDGYRLFGIPYNSPPSYISTITALRSVNGPDSVDYAMIDDPFNPGGNDIEAGTLYINGVNGEYAFASFVIGSGVPSLFRLGLFVDNGDSPNPPPLFRVAQTVGGAADSGSIQGNTLPDLNPDWYFVDVQGAQAGDVFTVYLEHTGSGNLLLGGLTFDHLDIPPDSVPEPSSAMLLGIGALMVQRLVRRRRQGEDPASSTTPLPSPRIPC